MTLFGPELQTTITMLYPTNPNFTQLLESFGEFLEQEIMPTAKKIDEGIFPRENLGKLFTHGFTSMAFPKQYGGQGLPYPVYIAAVEMLGMTCASTGVSAAIHGTSCTGIAFYGSEEQKTKYLKPLIQGEKLAAFALTEPHSGSDAGDIHTRAKFQDGSYILNGKKTFITNGGEADVYFAVAKTDNGPCIFLVDRDSKGLRIGENIEKLGIRGSTWTDVFFEDCVVPGRNLLGAEGQGFEYTKHMLQIGRIAIAALAVGVAQIAFEKALSFSKERVAFGSPISQFQMTRQKLADMSTEISAARQLTFRAAWMKQSGKDFSLQASQAKLFASETAMKVSDQVIQIHGGYGYADKYDVHRHWRDARMMTIGEGTSEIMRLVISHSLLQ